MKPISGVIWGDLGGKQCLFYKNWAVLKTKSFFFALNLPCESVSFLADITHHLGTPGPAGAGPWQLHWLREWHQDHAESQWRAPTWTEDSFTHFLHHSSQMEQISHKILTTEGRRQLMPPFRELAYRFQQKSPLLGLGLVCHTCLLLWTETTIYGLLLASRGCLDSPMEKE